MLNKVKRGMSGIPLKSLSAAHLNRLIACSLFARGSEKKLWKVAIG